MKKITSCNDCCFMNLNGEYGHTCNHPSIPIPKKEDDYQLILDSARIYVNEINYFSRIYTPIACPLRELKSIDVGIKIEIDLDPRFFEENVKDGKFQ